MGNCITLENDPYGSECLNMLYHTGADCGAQPQVSSLWITRQTCLTADIGCISQVTCYN